MPLPELNELGDLPEGRHIASLEEVITRFGTGLPRRRMATEVLCQISTLAVGTGHLDRMVIFGSYVSNKPEPNDVDVILVMQSTFSIDMCPRESLLLFDHARADEELGASIFWIRPDMLLGESLEQFLTHWEQKRDGYRRGIVEISS